VLLAAIAGALWLRSRAPAQAQAGPQAADALAQELVRKQLRLARAELDNKNYRVAISEAQGVLKLSAGNPEAQAVVKAAQDRLDELERSATEARRLVDAGDTAAASHELTHVLELDPNYPAAGELTSRLDSAFRTQAEQAAADVRAARQAASAAGAPPEALRAADVSAREADELMAKNQFAEATRTLLDARDALDRARRAAAARPATPAPRPTATMLASAPPAPAATPPPARGFTPGATSVRVAGSGPDGFEGAQVAGRPAQFSGSMEFEVLPPAVRPGDPFVVRIHLRNDGRKSVKIRGLALAAVVDGRRLPAAAKPLQREVQAQSRALVAEYSGVWNAPREWTLEAVVTADKDETVTNRLRAN
jgi:tetratricopeptide (TPR) repeat protein